MDPNTAWYELCKALRKLYEHPDDKEQRERAVDVMNVLSDWLKHGGFPPILEEVKSGREQLR